MTVIIILGIFYYFAPGPEKGWFRYFRGPIRVFLSSGGLPPAGAAFFACPRFCLGW